MLPDAPSPERAHRVTILASTDARRGAEVFSERLRDGLMALGWEASALALARTGLEVTVDFTPLMGGAVRPLKRFDRQVLRALRARIKADGPDVVVANGGATLRYAAVATIGLGIPFVYIGIGEPGYWFRSRSARLLTRLFLRRSAAVLAVSHVTRDQFVAVEPSIADRALVVHQGVPERYFTASPLRAEGPLKVVVIGALSEEKDPMAALGVVGAVPGCLARFVGDGPLRLALGDEVARAGLSDRVDLVGAVGDVADQLAWADVLLVTSRTEGLPGVVLEAAAAGRVVVSVDVGGVRDAVEDGVTGVVADDTAGCVDALRALTDDRSRLAAMAGAAATLAADRFTLEAAVARYAAALEGVIR